ncbi:N-acetylmuramoyl-L-alanine amidase [Rhodoblastus acidophilus]|nr:N-acetylmuramoyl-L-alanine amidase [Rhodoblastus acidophilus]
MAINLLKRAAFAAAAALVCAAQPTAARAETALPIAIAAHTDVRGRETRLSFTLQSCLPTEAYLLGNPARAIVDLPEVNFQIDPAQGEAQPAKKRRHRHHAEPAPKAGLIASYRFGRLAPGKSRIVADLTGPAAIVSSSCAPVPGADELTLVLAPASDADFKAAARAGARRQALADAPPPLPPAQPPSEKPVVVIDPGHGGVDTGALSKHHAIEKFIVLDFAKALGAKLTASGHYHIVFTRTDDTFVSLGERVRIARRLNAALFVSVHADSLPSDGDEVSGATIYTVSDRASDAEAAKIAEHENMADSAAGEETKEDAGDVNDILFDLTRRETRAYSSVFARSLAQYFKVAARLNKNPRRSAGFVVLKSPDVPSVLLELGYLSNARDVSDLTSPAWRDKATTQVAKAIDNYFAMRQPAGLPAASADAALKATQSGGN